MRFALVLLFAAAPMLAAPIADTYVIPVAGHLTGANGEAWTTDVMLHNVTGQELIVDLAGTVELNAATITVGPHASLTLTDIVRNGVGAIVLAGDRPFTLTSRIHTARVATEVPPVAEFIAVGGEAFLPGLATNARRRSNIGFFAVADKTVLRVEVTLIDVSGTSLGARIFEVPPGEMSHMQLSTRDISPAFVEGVARIRVIEGDGVLATYASVVDNASGDASFIAGAAQQASSSALIRRRVGGAPHWSER